MSTTLSFLLKLQDMLTPGMRQAAAASSSAASQIEGQMNKVAGSGKRMASSVDELRSKLDAVNKIRFSTTLKSEFDKSTDAARKLEKQISKLENKGSSGSYMGAFLGGAVGAISVGAIGKKALGNAAELEQQRISFGVMTGDEKTGNKMVSDIQTMGAATPYQANDLLKNAQTLKAFGIENEKVLPILKTIGDVASGDAQKMGSLSLAFAQVSSAGKLSGQDLLQMVNAGFNPLQQMVHDKVFPSMMEARKAMEKSAIGANMVEAAFKSATGPGGQFYQMMEKQSHTLAGRWSTFMDNVNMKLTRLGEILMPLASKVLNFGSALLEGAPWAVALASALGLVALSMMWATIQTTALTLVTRSATFFTGLFSAAQAVLSATMWANPITWIIASIIALIAIIAYVIYTTDGWGKQWDSIIKFFKFSWQSFKDYFNVMWLEVQDAFMTGLELIEKNWYRVKSLWDEDGAKAGLAKIANSSNNRAAELATARGVLASDLQSAQNALTWELHSNGKDLGTITGDIKKKLGIGGSNAVTPISANVPGEKVDYGRMPTGGGPAGSSAKGRSEDINSGGQRSIVINIGKQIEKIEQHIVGGSREAADEIETAVREAMRRVVYSLNNAVS